MTRVDRALGRARMAVCWAMRDATRETDSLVVLQRILAVLGVASIACTGRVIDGPNEANDEADEADEADATSSDSSESGSSSETGSSSESETDEGPIPDLGPADCSEFERVYVEFSPPPECTWEPDEFYAEDLVCSFPPAGTSCADAPFPATCYLDAYECGFEQQGDVIRCGPYTSSEGACCYLVGGECPVGRPFHVAGRARIAALMSTAGTDVASSELDPLDPLDHQTRAALADFWAREGLSEHASVASFARFTHQLVALGAPARLIGASLRAGLDEVRHAQRCFGLASTYAGVRVQPGPLDVCACMEGEQLDPRAIALSLAREGCIAETVSTLLLIAARDRARDSAVRACLAAIVEDELDHVLLAWEALAWMIERDPTLRDVLPQVFAQADCHVGFGAISELASDRERMREHGHLGIAERRAIAIDAIERIIRPSARTLLERTESESAHESDAAFAEAR
jgi:hypothetical protein